jgi:hypothetical protein
MLPATNQSYSISRSSTSVPMCTKRLARLAHSTRQLVASKYKSSLRSATPLIVPRRDNSSAIARPLPLLLLTRPPAPLKVVPGEVMKAAHDVRCFLLPGVAVIPVSTTLKVVFLVGVQEPALTAIASKPVEFPITPVAIEWFSRTQDHCSCCD